MSEKNEKVDEGESMEENGKQEGGKEVMQGHKKEAKRVR